MKRQWTWGGAIVLLAGLGLVAGTERGETQSAAPATLTVGIYAPTINFQSSVARLQYVQRLAKAIQTATGGEVTGKSFANLSSMKKAKLDFAIVDARCYVSTRGWDLLANAQVNGSGARTWALFSRLGPDMTALKGKKVAFVKTGCRDAEFTFNAMLESEVGAGHFGARVGKPTLQGAVAEVASFKGAEAVFAPLDSNQGLTKVFETTAIPEPAFVLVNKKLDASVVESVKRAVTGYGAGGAISGWTAANEAPYGALKNKMRKRVKRPVFAVPSPVRVDAKDVLIEPETLTDPSLTKIKHRFERPPVRQ